MEFMTAYYVMAIVAVAIPVGSKLIGILLDKFYF
jgi:hypothetical protein